MLQMAFSLSIIQLGFDRRFPALPMTVYACQPEVIFGMMKLVSESLWLYQCSGLMIKWHSSAAAATKLKYLVTLRIFLNNLSTFIPFLNGPSYPVETLKTVRAQCPWQSMAWTVGLFFEVTAQCLLLRHHPRLRNRSQFQHLCSRPSPRVDFPTS